MTIGAALAQPAAALDVRNVRFGEHPDKTRMVVELSAPADFRASVLTQPDRLMIDLPAYEWRAGDVILRGINTVSSVRQGALQPGINRIVVDTRRPVAISSAFLIPAAQGLPDRLVIDFKAASSATPGKVHGTLRVPDGGAPAPMASAPAPLPAAMPQSLGTLELPRQKPPVPARIEAAPQETAALARPPESYAPPPPVPPPALRAQGGDKPVIIIDAGHGGVDPGAIGANGVLEKNVTLAMARELKQQLEATGRYTVHLTRDSDKFLRLHQRVDFGRKKGADLFISLHADTISKPHVQGVSIYTLSEKASDKETAELADRENKVDLIAGADLSHADRDVASILVDLSMRDTMNQSKFFANSVVQRLKNNGLRLLESPHRYAGFAVLKAPDVPSVLIEIGFMSNKSEVRLLNDPAHRYRLGQSIAEGIEAYFAQVRQNSRT